MSLTEFIKYPRILMSIMAIYPKTEVSLFYRFRTFVSMGSVFLLYMCLAFYAAQQIDDVVKLSESLYIHISMSNSILKMFLLIYKRKEFFKCIDMLETPSFNAYNDQYNDELKQLKKKCIGVQLVYACQCNVTLVCFALFPVWVSKPLPLEFHHFNSGVFHYPFYLFEIFGLYMCAYANICLDTISVGFIMIAATQLRKLNRKLVDMDKNVKNLPNYSKETEEKLVLNYLKECCQHYSDIEEYGKCIQDCFSIISFMQMLTGCISICNTLILLGLSTTSAEATTLICYTFSMLGELLLYCWFGNFVYDESLEVLTSCFFSSWYECGPRVRRTLFILMERTKRPIEVKSLSWISLSLVTFLSILKWTYSCFALMRNYTM